MSKPRFLLVRDKMDVPLDLVATDQGSDEVVYRLRESVPNTRFRRYDPRLLLAKQVPYDNGMVSTESHEMGADQVAKEGQVVTAQFGCDIVTHPGIPGLPETAEHAFGIEHPYLLHHIVVDATVAECFDVTAVFVGARSLWHPNCAVPATRFSSALSEPIRFAEVVHVGQMLVVSLVCRRSARPLLWVTGQESDPGPVVAAALKDCSVT